MISDLIGVELTYAAGLDAATVIWIALKFKAEHRAALDWLNKISGPGFDFFGFELEVWRIGDSRLAPKFNLVCQPNDWAKQVTNWRTVSLTPLFTIPASRTGRMAGAICLASEYTGSLPPGVWATREEAESAGPVDTAI